MGVNSLIFLLLSSSFDPRVVPLWNCVRSMDNKNTGINPSLVRQPGKGVSVSWRRWEEELLMFSFPLFLSHSPAPKVVPVMDLQLPWQPKTLRKINKTKEKICFWSGQLRKGDVVIWRLWRNTCWFFSFSLFSCCFVSRVVPVTWNYTHSNRLELQEKLCLSRQKTRKKSL